MKRVTAATIFVVAVLGVVVLAQAQQAGKVPRVGILMSGSPSVAKPRLEAFQEGLRELGYIEGKNIVLEYRYAEGKPETLPKRVDELVQLKVDVIVTETSNATQAAKNVTTTIPVVFATANDPVGDGHVASLARPGGNITGFSNLAPELNGKKLELLKEAVSKLSRIAFLLRWGASIGERRFKEAEVAAKDLGLRRGKKRRRSSVNYFSEHFCNRAPSPDHRACGEISVTGDLPRNAIC
jgi:putative ABC transport system substrate-binding protein